MPKYQYNNFGEYWRALGRHDRPMLARLSGCDYNYLLLLAGGKRFAGPLTIARLSKVDRRITARLMRPDLYGKRVYVPRKGAKHALFQPGKARIGDT